MRSRSNRRGAAVTAVRLTRKRRPLEGWCRVQSHRQRKRLINKAMRSKPAAFLAVAWCLAGISCAGAGQPASAYPGKPVRIIVPWAPGGSTDLLARAAGQKLAETWKQPVIVDN